MREALKYAVTMAAGVLICKGIYESGRKQGIKECKIIMETAIGVAEAVEKKGKEES